MFLKLVYNNFVLFTKNFFMNTNVIKKGFTLIEILVVVTIIWILAVTAINSYQSSKAKSRDAVRIAMASKLENWVESFYDSMWAVPIAWEWWADEFEKATWVSDWSLYKQDSIVCTMRKNYNKEEDYIWKWFGPYIENEVEESIIYDWWTDSEYSKFAARFHDKESVYGWFAYKWVFTEDWEFKYQIIVPLEKSNIKARKDNISDWNLWDRYYEIWTLVWTDQQITKDELSWCFNDWKVFDIRLN